MLRCKPGPKVAKALLKEALTLVTGLQTQASFVK